MEDRAEVCFGVGGGVREREGSRANGVVWVPATRWLELSDRWRGLGWAGWAGGQPFGVGPVRHETSIRVLSGDS